MRILFIAPPNYRFRGCAHKHIFLGPTYMAGVLKGYHDVQFYDAEAPYEGEFDNKIQRQLGTYSHLTTSHFRYLDGLQDTEHYIWKEVAEVLRDFRPDVVGISTMTSSYPSALVIARIAKEITGATVLMGGAHSNVLYRKVATEPNVDYVVYGEGERTIHELMSCLEKGIEPSEVAGLAYMRNNQLVVTPPRANIQDLDELPFPDKTIVRHPERYSPEDFTYLISGRGCPSRCRFCANSANWGFKTRFRHPEKVLEEIIYLKDTYSNSVHFHDDNFFLSNKLMTVVCGELIKSGIKINWRGESRIDTISAEKLELAKASGCWDVVLGIESGSDHILSYIGKRLTVKQIMAGAEILVKSGVSFTGNFMFGFPEETIDDMRATLDIIKSLPAANIAISKFIPLPGTDLYNEVMAAGAFGGEPAYEHLDLFSNKYHYTKYVNREDFADIFSEIHEVVDQKNKLTRKGPPKPIRPAAKLL